MLGVEAGGFVSKLLPCFLSLRGELPHGFGGTILKHHLSLPEANIGLIPHLFHMSESSYHPQKDRRQLKNWFCVGVGH